MSWQQIAMIVWIALELGIGLEQSGEPKKGTYKFYPVVIGMAILTFILYTGGFWN